MQPDRALEAITRQWLGHARDDLALARSALKEGSAPFLRDALFHSQQAAEKALKAFLTWHDIPFRKVHDLEIVGAQCCEVDPSLASIVVQARELTRYAWTLRYPGEPYEPEPPEVSGAIDIAAAALEAVLSRLPVGFRD